MTVPRVRSRDTCATFPVTGALTTMQVIDACRNTTPRSSARHETRCIGLDVIHSEHAAPGGCPLHLPTHLAPCS